MSRAMDIGSVLDLNRLFQVGNQSPKLSLNILLGDRSMAVELVVEWHLLLKVTLLEVVCLLLELL